MQLFVEYNDLHGQANAYHNLGLLAQRQREWAEAKGYYEQALQIYGEYHDHYAQANTYYNLGALAQERRDWKEAEKQFLHVFSIFREFKDNKKSATTMRNLARLWRDSGDESLPTRLTAVLEVTEEEVRDELQRLVEAMGK